MSNRLGTNEFSALLEDLDDRGLLDETLVAWNGEFGRTPKINKEEGRDHWANVYSTVLAGGGIQGGQVHGASDKNAGEPVDHAVHVSDSSRRSITPWDFHPTRLFTI